MFFSWLCFGSTTVRPSTQRAASQKWWLTAWKVPPIWVFRDVGVKSSPYGKLYDRRVALLHCTTPGCLGVYLGGLLRQGQALAVLRPYQCRWILSKQPAEKLIKDHSQEAGVLGAAEELCHRNRVYSSFDGVVKPFNASKMIRSQAMDRAMRPDALA